MKKIAVLSLILFNILGLTSCSGIKSSINYTMGTDSLNSGNYSEAIEYLEEAVRLDPTMSRNQNNLAAAYMANGDFEKAWFHSRKAVLCKPITLEAGITFCNLYEAFVRERCIDSVGQRYENVISALGEPDDARGRNDGEGAKSRIVYGRLVLSFTNGLLDRSTISF